MLNLDITKLSKSYANSDMEILQFEKYDVKIGFRVDRYRNRLCSITIQYSVVLGVVFL